jgi:hypothetical protein
MQGQAQGMGIYQREWKQIQSVNQVAVIQSKLQEAAQSRNQNDQQNNEGTASPTKRQNSQSLGQTSRCEWRKE